MADYKLDAVKGRQGDVSSQTGAESWFYSDVVKEHFFSPKNFVMGEEDMSAYNAIGKVGSPACGDELRVWMKVDAETERIQDFRWKTFGCGSAIASTSMASVMVTENGGMTLAQARKLKPQDIMERLGGLPTRKFHCSVLCDKALRDAINDYYRRTDQFDKIIVAAKRLVDPVANVTDHDIEEAVLDGALTLDAVQQRTKVGIGNPTCLPAVEELIRFYREKYFGAD
ncbi:TPA: iron-sulfur cluster assembly scaffold protein [Candidatus Uhrbacteria bacterium]|nr:iron-sulfur cluster assembly scaffold protein [Candidatus Uhrbacteria bacterium]